MTDSDISKTEEDQRVLEVLDKYLQDREAGLHPDIQSVIARHPDIAHRLNECLPGIEAIEDFADAATESDANTNQYPEFSDYRILEELGRGGMGIVYRAEQISLPRPVALKILPFAAVFDEHTLQRFKNESLATAQLTHSNIIKVYSVGQEKGTYYYAMQLIDGYSLAEIIASVRNETNENNSIDGSSLRPSSRSLYGSGGSKSRDDTTTTDSTVSDSRSGTGILSHSNSHSKQFVRSVARVGVQVADALSHAHEQGIVHRDIKPSNLMVDKHGVVYVSDFGLARIQSEANVTMSGDVIGTLRYMSPEQAQAQHEIVDHRTDIYSLGATLYELLTLKSVNHGRGRKEVLKNLLDDRVIPPSKINASVPSDLETVVLKSLDPDRLNRYSTAREFADDLQRFLDNRPIEARRPTAQQRFRKWLKRNPWLASTAVVLTTLLLFGMIVSLLLITRQLRRAESAERHAERQTYDAIVGQIQATLATNKRGHRVDSEALIAKAASLADRLKLDDQKPILRSLSASAMRLLDLEPTEFRLTNEANWSANAQRFSRDLSLLATTSFDDRIVRVHSTNDTRELASLEPNAPGRVFVEGFGCDGKMLAISYRNGRSGKFLLWDWARDRIVVEWENAGDAVSFSPSGKLIAVGATDKSIRIFDVEKETLTSLIRSELTPYDLAFHPNENLIAITSLSSQYVLIKTLQNEVHSLVGPTQESSTESVDWNHMGNQIAVSSDRKVFVWAFDEKKQISKLDGYQLATHPIYVFDLNSTGGVRLCFHPNLPFLCTSSWSNLTQIWDLVNGREMLNFPGYGQMISADGTRIGVHDQENYIAKLGFGSPVQMLSTGSRELAWEKQPTISPDGSLVAQSRLRETNIWSTNEVLPLATLPVGGRYSSALFRPNGDLVTSSHQGLLLWKQTRVAEGRIRYGPPVRILEATGFGRADISDDGQLVAACLNHRVVICDIESKTRIATTAAHPMLTHVSLSADGNYVCSSTWHGKGVRIWDARTGTLVNELFPTEVSPLAYFDDAGKWLAVYHYAKGAEFFRIGTWEPYAFIGGGNTRRSKIVFSPTSRYALVPMSRQDIRLFDVAEKQESFRMPISIGYSQFDQSGQRLVVANGPHNELINLQALHDQFKSLNLELSPDFAKGQSHAKTIVECQVDSQLTRVAKRTEPHPKNDLQYWHNQSKENPSDRSIRRRYLDALSARHPQQAIDLLQESLTEKFERDDALRLIRLLRNAGGPEDALRVVDRGLDHFGDDTQLKEMRGDLLIECDQIPLAMSVVQELAEAMPHRTDLLKTLIQLQIIDGSNSHETLLANVQELRKSDPSDGVLMQLEMICHWKLRDVMALNRLLELAIQSTHVRKLPVIWLLNSLSMCHANDYETAAELARKAIRATVGRKENALDRHLRETLTAELRTHLKQSETTIPTHNDVEAWRLESEKLVSFSKVTHGSYFAINYNNHSFNGFFSGNSKTLWRDAKVGDRLRISIPDLEPGERRILIGSVTSYDYANVKLYWNGEPLAGPIALHSFETTPIDEIDLGTVDVVPDVNVFEVEIVGKNDLSDAYFFGFDYLDLWPLPQTDN